MPSESQNTEQSTQDPNAGGTIGGNSGGQQNQQPEQRAYSQIELDAMFAERAKRAKDQAQADILKLLGVENFDIAKRLLSQQQEAEEAAKSELTKAQEAATKANALAEQLKAEKDQAIAQARERVMRSAVIAEAMKQGFRSEAVDDVWLVIDKTGIEDDEKGEFKGIAQAVEKVAKERPFWLGSSNQKSPNQGTPKPTNQGSGQQKHQQNNQAPQRRFTL